MNDCPREFDFSPVGMVRLAPTGRAREYSIQRSLITTWLGRRERPKVLVAGADLPLGRWIVHLATDLAARLPLELAAQGRGPRPLYLDQAPYRRATYLRCDLARPEGAAEVARLSPDLVLFAEGEDDRELADESLYRANALAPAELARAMSAVARARPGGRTRCPSRLVYLSCAGYAPGEGAADETAPLDESDPVLRTRAEGERALFAIAGHPALERVSATPDIARGGATPDIEIAVLRIPTTTGPLETGVLAKVARALRLGLIPAPPGGPPREVSLATLGDAAWGAILLGLVDLPATGTVLHLASPPIALDRLLTALARAVQPEALLGIRSPLVRLFDLAFFEEFRIPPSLLPVLQHGVENANRILNGMRLAPRPPALDREVAQFLSGPRPLDATRFAAQTGWRPGPVLPSVAEMVRYHRETEWQDLARGESTGTRDAARAALEARHAAREIRRFRPATREGGEKRLLLPRLGIEIDVESLYILAGEARRFALARVGRADLSEMLTYRLPGLLGEIFSAAREAARREHHALLGGGGPPTLRDLRLAAATLSHLGRGELTEHLTAALLDRSMEALASFLREHRPALALVPDLVYGFLLETELGLVGLAVEKTGTTVDVRFPREEISLLAGIADRKKRLLEFRRTIHAGAVLSVPAAVLLEDVASGSFLARLLSGIGGDYLVTGVPRYYRFLSREIFSAAANEFYYLDGEGRIALGLVVDRGTLRLANPDRVHSLQRLLDGLFSPGELPPALADATGGRIRIRFDSLDRTRKLLAALLAPGPLARFIRVLRIPPEGETARTGRRGFRRKRRRETRRSTGGADEERSR
ncbi:MAG: hypothetical protein HY720_27975 [Planctomycetes bacterium]|nr:hypothetical protein [Planctomycetota bacterium]